MSVVRNAAAFVLSSSMLAMPARAQTPLSFDRTRTEGMMATGQALAPPLTVPVTAVAVQAATAGTLLHRVHFTIAAVSGPGWTIEVTAGGQTLVSGPLDATGEWWTPPLNETPAAVSARLVGPPGQGPPQVVADRIAVLVEPATPQAITPPATTARASSPRHHGSRTGASRSRASSSSARTVTATSVPRSSCRRR